MTECTQPSTPSAPCPTGSSNPAAAPSVSRRGFLSGAAVAAGAAALLLEGAGEGSVITADALTSENAYDYLVDLGVALNEHNVPMLGRWVVIPPWFHGLLLKAPGLWATAPATTRPFSRVAGSATPPASGFT